MPVGSAVDLWGLAGTVDDALVVGASGFVAPIVAGHVGEPIPCGLGNIGLRAVHATSDGVAYAVGEQGTIVRIEGRTCATEHGEPGWPTLNAVGRSPEGSVLAVGDDGRALVRSSSGAWEPADLGVTHEHLRGVRETDRSIIVVGTSGTVVEHVRIDGG